MRDEEKLEPLADGVGQVTRYSGRYCELLSEVLEAE